MLYDYAELEGRDRAAFAIIQFRRLEHGPDQPYDHRPHIRDHRDDQTAPAAPATGPIAEPEHSVQTHRQNKPTTTGYTPTRWHTIRYHLDDGTYDKDDEYHRLQCCSRTSTSLIATATGSSTESQPRRGDDHDLHHEQWACTSPGTDQAPLAGPRPNGAMRTSHTQRARGGP